VQVVYIHCQVVNVYEKVVFTGVLISP